MYLNVRTNLEPFIGIWVIRISIRMHFFGKSPIRLLDLVGWGLSIHAKDVVEISSELKEWEIYALLVNHSSILPGFDGEGEQQRYCRQGQCPSTCPHDLCHDLIFFQNNAVMPMTLEFGRSFGLVVDVVD